MKFVYTNRNHETIRRTGTVRSVGMTGSLANGGIGVREGFLILGEGDAVTKLSNHKLNRNRILIIIFGQFLRRSTIGRTIVTLWLRFTRAA